MSIRCHSCRHPIDELSKMFTGLTTATKRNSVWHWEEPWPTWVQQNIEQVNYKCIYYHYPLVLLCPCLITTTLLSFTRSLQSGWTKGRLHCPHCSSRIGGFDFIGDSRCHHPVYLTQSRLDRDTAASKMGGSSRGTTTSDKGTKTTTTTAK